MIQKTLKVDVLRNGQPITAVLDSLLEQGWRVVSATPLLSSVGLSTYTATVLYVLEHQHETA